MQHYAIYVKEVCTHKIYIYIFYIYVGFGVSFNVRRIHNKVKDISGWKKGIRI